eukprot:5259249-Amphidinium_carterae.1
MASTFCNLRNQNNLTGVLNKYLEAVGTIWQQYVVADNGVEHDHKHALALHRWHRDIHIVQSNLTMRVNTAGNGTELQWTSPVTICTHR